VKYHPIADIFPLLQGREFDELVADIKANGLIEPIWIHQGWIIDGRNRYRACEKLGIKPEYRIWEGEDLISFVVSMNVHRRHMTPSQCAAVAVEIKELLSKDIPKGRPKKESSPNLGNLPRDAEKEAAKIMNVSHGSVHSAEQIKAQSPELFAKVRAGEITIHKADSQLRREKAIATTKTVPKLEGKYRVIYADPPWKYNIGDECGKGGIPSSAAEWHYPAMTIDELCALPVMSLLMDDAVLFMWVTSPNLEQGFWLVNGWGFTYKACFVWDKIKHNVGHYNSVRHEFLFIATRGSCLPDDRRLIDSVQSIERTEHSVKPERFREIIDQMYPHGPRVELFARRKTPGWDVWGNQI
jgi:N6-adenosine-specific RNA methylase IME4